MTLQLENFIQPFLDSAYNVYQNKFLFDVTDKERYDIAHFMSCLVSIPDELNRKFCDFIFERPELPVTVACILFVSMNDIKKYDINKKYAILKNETKYSHKSINMLNTICEIYGIEIKEKLTFFGKTKIKLKFPLDIKDKILTEVNSLPKQTKKINNTLSKDYDCFVNWWANCNETEITGNEILFGAFQVMYFHNEVCNGGINQFFDFVEDQNWDMTQIKKRFKKLLPLDFYNLFEKAIISRNNGEVCENFDNEFDYDKMQNEVLPKIASKVMKILNRENK